MKKLLLLGAVLLLVGTTAMTPSGSQNGGVNIGARDRFNGAWRLAWLEEEGADGKVHRADCTGMLVYTPDGHMSSRSCIEIRSQGPPPGRRNMRKADTRPPLADMRSTNARSHLHLPR